MNRGKGINGRYVVPVSITSPESQIADSLEKHKDQAAFVQSSLKLSSRGMNDLENRIQRLKIVKDQRHYVQPMPRLTEEEERRRFKLAVYKANVLLKRAGKITPRLRDVQNTKRGLYHCYIRKNLVHSLRDIDERNNKEYGIFCNDNTQASGESESDDIDDKN